MEYKIRHKRIYLPNRNRLSDIENGLVVAKRGGGWGGMNREAGMSKRKLLHRDWIDNKVLL